MAGAQPGDVLEVEILACRPRLPYGTHLSAQWGLLADGLPEERVTAPLRRVGVAPAQTGRRSSIPPGEHGGNVDNWRCGAGARLFLTVQVPGALLSVGDPHVFQGDGEVAGTALEASLNGLLRLTVRRDLAICPPLLETRTEVLVHGFGDDLDGAMREATVSALDLLGARWGLSRPDAYALASLAVDFTVTQVVDGRLGVHARIDKRWFAR